MKKKAKEMVDHPSHYNSGKIEAIEYIKDLGIAEDFCTGNALKYISRYKHKGTPDEDIKKAIWYLEYLLNIINKDE